MPRRATVNISCSPSRRLAAALGIFLIQLSGKVFGIAQPGIGYGVGERLD